MSTANAAEGSELVVAEDGSIPAEQIARLGLRPGAHLRVVEARPADRAGQLGGSLPDFPDLAWEDFQRASELARRDVGAT
jgi:hypothetical protein